MVIKIGDKFRKKGEKGKERIFVVTRIFPMPGMRIDYELLEMGIKDKRRNKFQYPTVWTLEQYYQKVTPEVTPGGEKKPDDKGGKNVWFFYSWHKIFLFCALVCFGFRFFDFYLKYFALVRLCSSKVLLKMVFLSGVDKKYQ